MAQTIAEKLFSRHNLAGRDVAAGDILEARIDGAMVHYHANEPMHDLAREAGFKDGFDPEEVDDYLDEIVVEWRKTIEENNELRAAGARVQEMEVMQPDLEEVFVQIMQKS